jgi:hypothetical protein
MKLFISWSDSRSHIVAAKLKEWLPLVLPSAEPWLSSQDIRKGSRWQAETAEALQGPTAGILVLTKDNLASQWLHFEAGAISKAVAGSKAFVCTYLIDVDNADVEQPLGMFQSTTATEADTLQLILSLNTAAESPIPDDRLRKLYSNFWPELDEAIQKARTSVPNVNTADRGQREMIGEILGIVRSLARVSTNETWADAIRNLAETPGTATYDMFKRLDEAGVRLPSSLADTIRGGSSDR